MANSADRQPVRARLQPIQVLADRRGELGVEVDAVLGPEEPGTHGQQAGAGLGQVQD
ncbi:MULTISPECIES: hypothetical protein [unclassified Streptomyces]|uniref:hypothetical protein n=1 Tax=unclassified Streptomyces TaxID=2593676 RepID=UPI00324CA76C